MMKAVEEASLFAFWTPVPAGWQNHVIQDHGIYPAIYSEVRKNIFGPCKIALGTWAVTVEWLLLIVLFPWCITITG